MPSTMEARGLNHWPAREVPSEHFMEEESEAKRIEVTGSLKRGSSPSVLGLCSSQSAYLPSARKHVLGMLVLKIRE